MKARVNAGIGRVLRRTLSVRLVLAALCTASPAAGQTFVQIQQLGSSVGPRMTRAWAVANVFGSRIFFQPHGAASYVVDPSGSRYRFAADPVMSRVAYGLDYDWVTAFDGSAMPSTTLQYPVDVDFTGSSLLLIADPGAHRIIVASFNGSSLTALRAFDASLAEYPVSVAWDGGSDPFHVVNAYIADAVHNRVEYWTSSQGSGWVRAWNYGHGGTGTGAFANIAAVCVGHSASSSSATSAFTSNFYVADAGNHRIVWLTRGSSGATWKKAVSLPNGGAPNDCTVDHFGNVYVSDSVNNRIVKYTYSLYQLDTYGTYGTGVNNLNTFAHIKSIHVPFGPTTNGSGQQIWFGEGRIVSAEDWDETSGGVEHWLGVALKSVSASVGGGLAQVNFTTTDHAQVSAWVQTTSGHVVRTLFQNWFQAPGPSGTFWDGQQDDGTPAPSGTYEFVIAVLNAYQCHAGCASSSVSPTFHWNECTLGSGGGGGGGAVPPAAAPPNRGIPRPNLLPWQPPPCTEANPENVALNDGSGTLYVEGHIPGAYALHQSLSAYRGPLFQIEGSASPHDVASTDAVQSVRANGITVLRMDVPRDGAGVPITVRVYDLSGRLVRTLVHKAVAPGSYEIGWDGLDDKGMRSLPGVYIAVMSTRAYTASQRLIVK